MGVVLEAIRESLKRIPHPHAHHDHHDEREDEPKNTFDELVSDDEDEASLAAHATDCILAWMTSRAAIASGLAFLVCACAHDPRSQDDWSASGYAPLTIVEQPLRIDTSQKLLSWSRAPSPYAHVAGLAWHALETKFPVQDNGLPTYLGWSRFDPVTFEGVSWPHNPAGLYAMLADSAVLWYEFSGDADAVNLVRSALDYQLAHGTTPRDWSWGGVPYASAGAGDTEYGGADDSWCDSCGRGDGIGVIEPDKVGELGFAYLQFYELTGEASYQAAAIACADALASHVREGDDKTSPWPFRVYAQTNVVREEYSANLVGALSLFEELERLGLGDTEEYERARGMAFDWLMRVPMQNDAWSGYFEDIEIQKDPGSNPNQYAPMRVARWLLFHPEVDPSAYDHVAHLFSWVEQTFGADTDTEQGSQWGATVMSEQAADMVKMGSHTARYGATLALWAEARGDAEARERAGRSLNWATYACSPEGVVSVGEDKNEGWWFSDGYGDYIRHFLVAMGAVPEWAPPGESHLLRSTSVVSQVEYGPGRVAYRTFDGDSTETLSVPSSPTQVTAGGQELEAREDLEAAGYTVAPLAGGNFVVRVRHTGASEVVVETAALFRTGSGGAGEQPSEAAAASSESPSAQPESPARSAGCSVEPTRVPGSLAWLYALGALAVLLAARRRSTAPKNPSIDASPPPPACHVRRYLPSGVATPSVRARPMTSLAVMSTNSGCRSRNDSTTRSPS
jgi:hypothetical protein